MSSITSPAPEIACTVVVPVFNRGEALEAGIASLRAQSLGAEGIEIIYVDDGSDDGYTPSMLDEVVAANANARVFHEPASGSPGRPRNVGLAHANGEYVFFSDHDDWFDPRALERLVGWARTHGSDVVIGKVVGHGRRAQIPRLFSASRGQVPAPEAMISLTPHKLFRRAFLDAHQIRYPEGKRRLEDHHFVTHAYLHAGTISVYADNVCYHHNDPGTDENFSQTRSDPALYIGSNVEVIELIRRHTADDPALFYAMLERPVLHELVYKAAPGQLRQVDAEGESRKHDAIRAALQSVPVEVIDRLATFPRATANALLRDDASAVVQLATEASKIGLAAELVDLRSVDAKWLIDYRATVVADGSNEPEGIETPAITNLEVLVINRESSVQWHLSTTYHADLRTVSGRATLDFGDIHPERIDVGLWDVVLRADVLGLPRRTRLAVPGDRHGNTLTEATPVFPGMRAAAFVTKRRSTLAVRVTTSGRPEGA